MTPQTLLRAPTVRASLVLIVLGTLGVSLAVVRQEMSTAYTGMPEEQQVYWSWVGALARGDSTVVEQGFDLLYEYPQVQAFYLRLADACVAQDMQASCRDALQRIEPAPEATLYREAALILLAEDDLVERWQRLADQPALDPTIARRIVDELRRQEAQEAQDAVESLWHSKLRIDSSATGVLFGVGYLAVQRQKWADAEPILRHLTSVAPDDPQAYRELGRIYYLTGQPEQFEGVLTRGIEAAAAQNDLEQELILRGNLGWGLVQRSGDLDRAAALFEEAISQSRILADGETEGFNLYRLAEVRLRQHRYDDALALLDDAEVLFARHVPTRTAEVSVLRGTVLREMYRFSEAEAALEQAINEARQERHVTAESQASVALAQLQYRMGRYAAAAASSRRALGIAERYQLYDTAIGAYMALGDIEYRQGDFSAAEAQYRRGLERAEQAKNQSRIRELYRRLGRNALSVHDAGRAQFYYERLLNTVGADEAELAQVYTGLGNTYARYQNFEEALRYYDLALTHLMSDQGIYLRINVLLAQAWAYLELSAYDQAAEVLETVRPLVISDPERSFRYEVVLGNLYLSQAAYRDALKHFQRAEQVYQRVRPSMRWHVLHAQALAYWQLGDAQRAEEAFSEAIHLIETLRSHLDASEERSFFVQDKTVVYENYAAFLEEQGRLDEALYHAERARSRSLVDLLYTTQGGRAVDAENAADQAIEMDRRMKALAVELSQEPDQPEAIGSEVAIEDDVQASATREAYLQRELERSETLYEEAQLDLAVTSQMYVYNPILPDSARAILRPDEALLFYNLRTIEIGARQEDRSMIYVVLPDTVIMRPLAVDEVDLVEAVRFFRGQITNEDGGPGTGWQPTARHLYDELIVPVVASLPARVKHLHIIPEGVLHYLPFAALQDEQERFLVERFTLSVAPSASILSLSRKQNPRRWRSMLLLADPDGRLPGAREEVRAIAARSPARRISFVGAEATEQNLIDRAPAFDILHLATHGQFVGQAPWRSHLELSGSPLSIEEIGNLNLDSYLVTLSACETALSGGLVADIPNGDEWVGLNQAFLAAGTPTVMASLWPIDDAASSQLMIGFYDRLGPEGKSHALATMQRHFLQNPQTRHPFYWAAFTVIGDPL